MTSPPRVAGNASYFLLPVLPEDGGGFGGEPWLFGGGGGLGGCLPPFFSMRL